MAVILNADDLGKSESVNLTIQKLYRMHLLSSTSIMAGSRFFEHAVEIAHNNPGLGIGVHLCLDGPYHIGAGYHTIMDSKGSFYSHLEIRKRISRFSVDSEEIYKEYCLQIEKVLDYHISISHLDHHHHLHLFLPALNSMIKAARKYKVPCIRSQNLLMHRQSFINILYRKFHQAYLMSRVITPYGHFEPEITANSDFENQFNRLSALVNKRNRNVEVVMHPTSDNDPETKFFMDSRVRDLLSGASICNYNDLIK